MEIKQVGVIGCGTMGSGIALVFASAGYTTVVSDTSDEALQNGLTSIRRVLQREVDRGRMVEEDMGSVLARLSGTIDLSEFGLCDLVVEAVVEDLAIKKQVFTALDEVCRIDTVFATNTSSLPIVEIATGSTHPERVIGMHFFNPAFLMRLVELVATIFTNQESIAAVRELVVKLGKTPILARDRPGFIVNRLLIPYLLDAIRVYDSGLATAEDIDLGITLGLNHPMGPLALADLIGLDVVLSIAEVLHLELGEARFNAPPVLRRMVAGGRTGRKAGGGFYGY